MNKKMRFSVSYAENRSDSMSQNKRKGRGDLKCR